LKNEGIEVADHDVVGEGHVGGDFDCQF
jgi:hypothetical protein